MEPMEPDDYPFTPSQKLFEQTGWLKAELERLRTDMVRETDLLRLEKRLEGFIISRDEERTKVLMGELDRAFERGIPGTQQLVQAEVQKVQERQAAEFEDSLVKAGLERKPDGSFPRDVTQCVDITEIEGELSPVDVGGQALAVEVAAVNGSSPAHVIHREFRAFCLTPELEYGLRLREMLQPANTIVLGYSNGYGGYVPTVEAFEEGGFEPGGSPYTSAAESMVLETAAKLAKTDAAGRD